MRLRTRGYKDGYEAGRTKNLILMNIDLNNLDQKLIDLALAEDLGEPYSDVTTKAIFGESKQKHSVQIVSKASSDIVICGLTVIPALLKKVGTDFQLNTQFHDGDMLKPSQQLLTISGNAEIILMAERTLLNFLRHLSAISTLTKQFVDLIKHTNTKILDTRKTTPGMRHLEKYAVACGGGVNHRMGLYDAYMIKDTHIDLAGGMINALSKIPNKTTLPIIVEVRSIDELKIVIENGKNKVTRVLLDNMSLNQLRESISLCKNIFETESSGNINLQTVKDVAETGVDYVSIGMLTYAAGQVDLSMQGI